MFYGNLISLFKFINLIKAHQFHRLMENLLIFVKFYLYKKYY